MIFDIHDHVEVKLEQVIQNYKYFSLVLDESAYVTDQLLGVSRKIDNAFDVHEETLKLASLHDTTKGSDILNARTSAMREYGSLEKMSTIVTEGTPAMQEDIVVS
ncbi:unnamed protein product [Lepeophtheirus salmonis]|uniref:(salmon louse) hypothetical protein n=1 Tax=Lepeophtheirus salmonis TaxID=72036 RepID=A0A7R8CIL6_LEPSM|nr:unnamed protein product [Lepeophtheirus salmonis]CAF2833514.1 unnamed protein product [Lepeophtheirus salmonis]